MKLEQRPPESPDLRGQLAGLARRVHAELIADTGDDRDAFDIDIGDVRHRARSFAPLCSEPELDLLVAMVQEQLYGLGPLDPLLGDDTITEVMINGPGPVWLERDGTVVQSGIELSADELRLVVERVVGPLGLRLDRMLPFADARLPDGSRVHVAIPPMALDGPYVTIRRFSRETLPLHAFGDPAVTDILRAAVTAQRNILVSGGTGTGKTSLVNSLGRGIAPGERVVTIEDAAELRLPGEHTVRLEARPPSAEGLGEITIRTLVRNALRMRPDRIIVGEVRGAEAFDMVQALNTGHHGCLSTCHANSPQDALDRVAAMVLAGDAGVPAEIVARQVRAAFDLVVHLARGAEGSRRVQHIIEVGREADRPLVAQGRCVS